MVRASKSLSRLPFSLLVALSACASCSWQSRAGDAAVSSAEGSAAEASVTDGSANDGRVGDGSALDLSGTQIASCDPPGLVPGTANRLAGLDRANGPPPALGDFVRATIEGQSYDFSTTFDAPTITASNSFTLRFARGSGQNGSNVQVTPLASGDWRLGSSDCTSFALGFANPAVGLEAELWYSRACCYLDVTKLATAEGDTVEGTFSGVVVDSRDNKLRITDGAFRVTARGP